MEVVNPATGEVVEVVPEDDAASVAARSRAARLAQPEWAARPIDDRIDVLRKFRAHVVYRLDELAAILTTETGKPIAHARNELHGLLPRLDFFLDRSADLLADEVVTDDPASGLTEIVTHDPLGVVANISAWNYPYFVGANVFVPALIAGNAVLYKPSEFATLTGRAVAEMLWGSGVPEDAFALVVGEAAVGGALVDQDIDGVFFTGSQATGERIAAALAAVPGGEDGPARDLAGRSVHLQLELGGKDPAYVTEDADVEAAAASLADGAFYNAGQSCCSVERIYVHRAIHDRFVDAFVDVVRSFETGDPTDPDTYLGPLTRPAQLAVLEAQVADAVALGAEVRTGGRRIDRPGNWFEPTVVIGATHEMALMREESFGPLIGIAAVDGDDEAVDLMNDTSYGLTAAVYTPDEGRARALLARLDTGSAYWNCCDRVSPRLPWSGRRQSGVGATLGAEGIRAFTRPRAWHLRRP